MVAQGALNMLAVKVEDPNEIACQCNPNPKLHSKMLSQTQNISIFRPQTLTAGVGSQHL